VSASYFKVIDGRYKIPVKPIVFVFAWVGIFNDAENLALPVNMLDWCPDGGLLSIMLLLLFG